MAEIAELSELARWTVEEVKARFDRGERITFLDVRGQKEWENSHEKLPGATRVIFSQLDERLNEIPRSGTIVAY